MVLGRVKLTLDLEWHPIIFRHIFTFQVHTVQCVKSTLSLVGSLRSPFAIGTHSDQYYDAPRKTLCLWRALPVPKDCEESNHVNVLNWTTPPCSKSTFKEYGSWWNTFANMCHLRPIWKRKLKGEKKTPSWAQGSHLHQWGIRRSLSSCAPIYPKHIYLQYTIQHAISHSYMFTLYSISNPTSLH